jgi:DNA-binding NarL/FixJ family response regulator
MNAMSMAENCVIVRPSEQIRVVLLHSQQLTCDLFRAAISANAAYRVVDAATEPTIGLDLVAKHRAQITIVDGSLPGNGALIFLDSLGATERCSREIVVGPDIYPAHIREAVRLGAAGYFTYRDPLTDVTDAISEVSRGNYAFGRSLSKTIVMTPDGPQMSRHTLAAGFATLTERELDVLACLVRGDTVPQCARRLNLSPSTVDNHKTRIMGKLDVHRMIDLVRLAIKRRLVPDW